MPREITESRLIGAIYGAAADFEKWPHVLSTVSDWAGATGGLIAYHPNQGEGDFLIPGRLDTELSVRYLGEFPTNPWSRALAKLPPHELVQMRKLVEHSELECTEFYHQILRPQRIVDGINWVEPSVSREGSGGFGFQLTEDQSSNATRVKGRLSRVRSHLSQALELSVRLAGSNAAATGLEAVLEMLPHMAFLLNAKGRILFANSTADNALQARNTFCISSDNQKRLTTVDVRRQADLAYAIEQASKIASSPKNYERAPSPMYIEKIQSSDVLAVCAIALPPSAFSQWQSDTGARILILAYQPLRPGAKHESFLRKIFGLTSSEAQVAITIGTGLSREQSAALLKVGPETVKTHVRRCFAKMNVSSSSQMANLIAALSVLP